MINRELAKDLLQIKAVTVVDTNHLFTWVSGIKSPIYCDNRMTISFPKVRKKIAEAFAQKINSEFPEVQVIAGTATAGIPHAAWVADILNLPMVYVRSSAKGHGKGNQIEGQLDRGVTVVLIEDLFSTGGSSLKAYDALVEAGGDVKKVYGIFSYNFTSMEEKFVSRDIPFETLTDYKTLLPVAIEENYVPKEDFELLTKWSENPRMFVEE